MFQEFVHMFWRRNLLALAASKVQYAGDVVSEIDKNPITKSGT